MKSEEIYLFAQIEKEHFFYRARRDLVRRWLPRLLPGAAGKIKVIEAGAGTGIMLDELRPEYDAVGCDLYFDPEVSLDKTHMVRSDARFLPFADEAADATLALDLIEHLDDDLVALKEFKRITRPGGYIFLNVPAFPLLFSDWDRAVGHKRRYKKDRLQMLAQQAGLEMVFLNYVNSMPFFSILIYRQLRSAFGIGKNNRLEDKLPPRWINRLLLWAFIQQGTRSWINLPFGMSLFAILKKPGGNH